jgi:hypothetical protein
MGRYVTGQSMKEGSEPKKSNGFGLTDPAKPTDLPEGSEPEGYMVS